MPLAVLASAAKRFLLEVDVVACLTFKMPLRMFSRLCWTIRPFRYIVSPLLDPFDHPQ
jgi:hypothetical protein